MIYPYSSEKFLEKKRVMLDSNILIVFLDYSHKFHELVRDKINKLFMQGANFYYCQPCLLELKNYWCRKRLTECINTRRQEGVYFFRKFEKLYLEFQKGHNSDQAFQLRDHHVKELRKTLENIVKGKGVEFWFQLCRDALTDELAILESELNKIHIKYAKFNDNDVFPGAEKELWPKWTDADKIQESYGLSANDAAIVNMTNGGKEIDGFVSIYGDMLFASSNGAFKDGIDIFTFLNSKYLNID